MHRAVPGRLHRHGSGAGAPVGKPTAFFVGTRVGSYGDESDNEYAYARRKVAAGIHFLATPPVFDLEAFFTRLDMIGTAQTPVLMTHFGSIIWS